MQLEISKEDAEIILKYLVNRPFLEVHKLVPILLNLKPTIDPSQTPEAK